MNYQCAFCQIRSFESLLIKSQLSEEQKDKATYEFLQHFSKLDFNKKAPEVSGEIQDSIRKVLNNTDPFATDKHESNQLALQLYPQLKKLVYSSNDKLDKAIRLSIAGNIIDRVATPDFDLEKTISTVLTQNFAIDHTKILKERLAKAETILYLGDNAGEIVLDKLFIELLGHPNLYFAVRGAPVINDATLEDAKMVGMDSLAKVISNGDNSPTTLLHGVSDEFLEIYNKADLIISKGMGNLEALYEEMDKRIFFLLMIKCDLIGQLVGAKKGEFVVVNPTLNI